MRANQKTQKMEVKKSQILPFIKFKGRRRHSAQSVQSKGVFTSLTVEYFYELIAKEELT